MKMQKFPHALCCTALAVFACAIPAYATSAITFVSATGSDSNACSQTSPCATFQGAINKTADGGEVDALTAGSFGSFVINNSITIDGKGLATVQETSGQAIAVNEYATTDTVVLKGLSINGGSSGVEGIYYPGSGNLVVENCIITGFTYDGIVNVTNGNSLLYVKNTTINGGATGVYVNEDGGSTILEHVTITGTSSYGVEVLNSPGSLTINDSLIVGGAYGVDVQSSAFYGTSLFNTILERVTITGTTTGGLYVGVGTAGVDSSTFFSNATAMEAASGSTIRISNSNIYNNQTGVSCIGSGSSTVQATIARVRTPEPARRFAHPSGPSTSSNRPSIARIVHQSLDDWPHETGREEANQPYHPGQFPIVSSASYLFGTVVVMPWV
jgi:hypothetical protein